MKTEYTIVEKGWQIDLSRIKDGWESDTVYCSAPTLNKAKSTLLDNIRYYGWVLEPYSAEVTYLNIPVIRYPLADKVMFDGDVMYRWKVDELIQKKDRQGKLQAILDSPDIHYCYIYKRGYYCPGWAGYTDHKWAAGVYTKEEAVEHAWNIKEIHIEPINIEEHNKKISEKIADLQSRLINI